MLIAASDPAWYLLIAPLSLGVATFGLWLSQKGERARRRISDERIRSAMFGYEEGATKVPGIYDIVVADGNGGSLSAIVTRVDQVSVDTSVKMANLTENVKTHIADDAARWEIIDTNLDKFTTGQREAAAIAITTAEDVADTVISTAADVKQTAESTAEGVAQTALNTALKLAQTALDTAKALHEKQA